MRLSRRKFLGAAPVAAAAILQLNGVTFGQKAPTLPPVGDGGALGRMTFLTFFEKLNTEFLFLNKDGIQVPLNLYAVEDVRPLAKRQWGKGQENFVLKFLGPTRYPLKQGTYAVEHFALDKFNLFITDGRDNKDGFIYLAVINRVDS